jgi:hypothetical protein
MPSAEPTLEPTYAVVMTSMFSVNQPLSSVDSSTFSDSSSQEAFSAAVASTMTGIEPSQVQVTSANSTSTGRRKLLRDAQEETTTTTQSCVVGYTVTFTCMGSGTATMDSVYSSLVNQLNEAVSSGAMTDAITSQAVEYNATGLSSAEVTTEPGMTTPTLISMTGLSPSPTLSPTSLASGIAMDIGVLSASVFIVFCAVAIASVGFIIWQRRVWNTVTGASTPLSVLSLVGTATGLSVSTLATAANIALVAHILSSNVSKACSAIGALLLVVRLVYWLGASVATFVNTRNHHKLLIPATSISWPVVLCVGLLHFFSGEAVKLLPWIRTHATDVSGGYATTGMMSISTISNVVLAVIVFILSLAALGQEHRDHDTRTMAAVSMVFSALLLLVAGLVTLQAQTLIRTAKLSDSITSEGAAGNDTISIERTNSTNAESIIVKEAMNSSFQPGAPSLTANSPPPTSRSSQVRNNTQVNPIHAAAQSKTSMTNSIKSFELSVNARSAHSQSAIAEAEQEEEDGEDGVVSGRVVNQIITEVLRSGPANAAASSEADGTESN